MKKINLFYVTIIIWIILDLYSKYLAKIYLQEKINLVWDFLFLKFAENRGIAFSINIPFLKILTIILIIWIFYYYIKYEKQKKNKFLDFSFWLILAWAVWNWIERVFNSKVIDFIWVKYFSIFNLADSFISLWAFIVLCLFLVKEKK